MGYRILVAIVAAIVIIVGFAASELAIWKSGDYKPLSSNVTCPTINVNALPGNRFVFQKQM